MSLPKIFKYGFTVKLVLPNGNKAAISGDVFDVDGYPNSARQKAKDACAETAGPQELYANAVVVLRKSSKPVQRLKIHREPAGMEGIEHCLFCQQPTRYWHRKNTPVCDECAMIHSMEELNERLK